MLQKNESQRRDYTATYFYSLFKTVFYYKRCRLINFKSSAAYGAFLD